MTRLTLCKASHEAQPNGYIYAACTPEVLTACVTGLSMDVYTLPVVNVLVHDSEYSRRFYDHPVDLDTIRFITGDYSLQGETVQSAALPYQELFSTEIDLDIPDALFSVPANPDEYIEHVPEHLRGIFLGTYENTFVMYNNG